MLYLEYLKRGRMDAAVHVERCVAVVRERWVLAVDRQYDGDVILVHSAGDFTVLACYLLRKFKYKLF